MCFNRNTEDPLQRRPSEDQASLHRVGLHHGIQLTAQPQSAQCQPKPTVAHRWQQGAPALPKHTVWTGEHSHRKTDLRSEAGNANRCRHKRAWKLLPRRSSWSRLPDSSSFPAGSTLRGLFSSMCRPVEKPAVVAAESATTKEEAQEVQYAGENRKRCRSRQETEGRALKNSCCFNWKVSLHDNETMLNSQFFCYTFLTHTLCTLAIYLYVII